MNVTLPVTRIRWLIDGRGVHTLAHRPFSGQDALNYAPSLLGLRDMRIAFHGTAELASPCREAVAKVPGHDIVAVVHPPDRPKGRDLNPRHRRYSYRRSVSVSRQQPLESRPAAIDPSWSGGAPFDLIVVVA